MTSDVFTVLSPITNEVNYVGMQGLVVILIWLVLCIQFCSLKRITFLLGCCIGNNRVIDGHDLDLERHLPINGEGQFDRYGNKSKASASLI